MALRVLLADESTTIKKVMQLALQDFAVEVKAVHAGVDVVDVARSFQPDIIFADVLLQKKNGYEVCGMLKADSQLKSTPVVLMWSSFMDLDDAQAKASGADARLEKPFDVETLRKIVLECVPKTRSQRLAHFLDFSPKLNDELKADLRASVPRPPPVSASLPPTPEPKVPKTPPPRAAAPASSSAPPKHEGWSVDSFSDPSDDEDESFQPLELSRMDRPAEPASPAFEPSALGGDDEAWSRQDLSQFKLDLPPVSVGEGHEEFKLDMGEQEFAPRAEEGSSNEELDPDFGHDLTLDADDIANATEEIPLPLEPLGLEQPIPQIPADRLEEIIRAQSREVIESVVRKIVPDLASTIIREELERLLQ